ncbi:eukaryotic peptide chain release factor GTP-binding subunit ERF3B-like [Notolabrus celidotus]|uniref:eukaryotic peptide chain release factor GTP-binding subunit ERF3B-like n=1 Tax=Notolabrus celidotus TaxID=1203425 RepID=UPI0014904361|nr:eukaryotic peptide chain release factor GTP-binding subunit ERF3B-like [Notolabrus celidotus]
MDPTDTAPDSWELEEDAEAPAAAAGLQSAFAALNVNAKPFVPNVNAPVFVPSFLAGGAVEIPASDGAPDAAASMEVAETAGMHPLCSPGTAWNSSYMTSLSVVVQSLPSVWF